MKGVLLHGGHGVRLRPLTTTIPKQLISIAGKPVSQWCLEDLRNAGIRDVGIVLGDVAPERVERFYGGGSRLGLRITYVKQGTPLGVAHAVSMVEEYVAGENFVVYLGDSIFADPIKQHVDRFEERKFEAMLVLARSARHTVSAVIGGGRVVRLERNPDAACPVSRYALTGVYIFPPQIFDSIRSIKPSPRGEFEIADAVNHRIGQSLVVKYGLAKHGWSDTGTLSGLLEANRMILGTESHVERDTDVQNSAKVEDHSSVGHRCRLSGCRVSSSILMDDCSIEGNVHIVNCVVGTGAMIVKRGKEPRELCGLVLGENSLIHLV